MGVWLRLVTVNEAVARLVHVPADVTLAALHPARFVTTRREPAVRFDALLAIGRRY
jgi:hypothetical protein